MNTRNHNLERISKKDFDVLILGGGISGASVYRELSQKGYKVCLLEKGDFACGTSQASAMMIWGGLLYLQQLDFKVVRQLCKDRDELIKLFSSEIEVSNFKYVLKRPGTQNKYLTYLALQLYWLLGKGKYQRPHWSKEYIEQSHMLFEDDGAFTYQEGKLRESDARFVLDWILDHQGDQNLALNYSTILGGAYCLKERKWRFEVQDTVSHKEFFIKAKCVVNCTGIWVDETNKIFDIQTPYKHVFSKGVFAGYSRLEDHQDSLFFEMKQKKDVIGLLPWGPISLWGPTEKVVTSIEEGYTIEKQDLEFLEQEATHALKHHWLPKDIISLRCGVRPLVVPKDYNKKEYSLNLSRHYKIHKDDKVPWVSVYGGKISGSLSLARELEGLIQKDICCSPESKTTFYKRVTTSPSFCYPGIEGKFPTIDFCVKNEMCCTLQDYMRRRTNIAQWVCREGLGKYSENTSLIANLSNNLPIPMEQKRKQVEDYIHFVKEKWDPLIC